LIGGGLSIGALRGRAPSPKELKDFDFKGFNLLAFVPSPKGLNDFDFNAFGLRPQAFPSPKELKDFDFNLLIIPRPDPS
jgi:hypothetical protein